MNQRIYSCSGIIAKSIVRKCGAGMEEWKAAAISICDTDEGYTTAQMQAGKHDEFRLP